MRPFGFFNAKIQSNLTHQNNLWAANFKITPGESVRVTQVELDIIGPGNKDRAFERARKRFPIKAGQILQTERYESSKQLLFSLASMRGYFHAKMLVNKIYINLKTHQARVVFKFKRGHVTFLVTPYSLTYHLALHSYINF